MKETGRLPLVQLSRALIEAGYEATSYQRLYTATVSGRLPARQGHNGRWTFDPADLPQIADAMGLAHT